MVLSLVSSATGQQPPLPPRPLLRPRDRQIPRPGPNPHRKSLRLCRQQPHESSGSQWHDLQGARRRDNRRCSWRGQHIRRRCRGELQQISGMLRRFKDVQTDIELGDLSGQHCAGSFRRPHLRERWPSLPGPHNRWNVCCEASSVDRRRQHLSSRRRGRRRVRCWSRRQMAVPKGWQLSHFTAQGFLVDWQTGSEIVRQWPNRWALRRRSGSCGDFLWRRRERCIRSKPDVELKGVG